VRGIHPVFGKNIPLWEEKHDFLGKKVPAFVHPISNL